MCWKYDWNRNAEAVSPLGFSRVFIRVFIFWKSYMSQACNLLKRYYDTDIFLWVLPSFYRTYFVVENVQSAVSENRCTKASNW